jgi:hypothetical protein
MVNGFRAHLAVLGLIAEHSQSAHSHRLRRWPLVPISEFQVWNFEYQIFSSRTVSPEGPSIIFFVAVRAGNLADHCRHLLAAGWAPLAQGTPAPRKYPQRAHNTWEPVPHSPVQPTTIRITACRYLACLQTSFPFSCPSTRISISAWPALSSLSANHIQARTTTNGER